MTWTAQEQTFVVEWICAVMEHPARLFQFTNSLGQAANHKIVHNLNSEVHPGQEQFQLGCMWTKCGSNGGVMLPRKLRWLKECTRSVIKAGVEN